MSSRFSGESNPNARLTEADIRTIRERIAAGHVQRAIARDYGVDPTLITMIRNGKRWAGRGLA